MDMNQVTIEVLDFDISVEFYQRLGLKLIVSARGEYARFELPSGSSTLSLHVTQKPSVGGAIIYFEVENVDQNFAEFSKPGIKFDSEPTDQSWRWREARFLDPSGNRLCIYHAGNDRRFPPWRIASV